jgi:hypothetical protein
LLTVNERIVIVRYEFFIEQQKKEKYFYRLPQIERDAKPIAIGNASLQGWLQKM